MTTRPKLDMHELVKDEVAAHMKPFIQVTMEEHEKTRKSFTDLEKVVLQLGSNRTHAVINSLLIAVLFIGMVVLFSTCG